MYTVSMASEIEVGGNKYVTSRVAAKQTGYAQDYIGQLARSGDISAERSGGLWYVDVESIKSHRLIAAENAKKSPVVNSSPSKLESVVTFDGKDYVSSKRGAKITGYSHDYVSQLARTGKIISRQISNRWYVSKNQLLAHKEHNDALLASVQSEAVGLQREISKVESISIDSVPALSYFSDKKDLMPTVHEKAAIEVVENEVEEREDYDNNIHNIPINVGGFVKNSGNNSHLANKNAISISQHVLELDEILDERLPEASIASIRFEIAGAILTALIVVAIGVGIFLPSNSEFTRNKDLKASISAKSVKNIAIAILGTINSYTLDLSGGSLQYNR
jgi:hypothetical protein